ncbi:glyoxalase [Corynebacterium suranareeae]|uniref:Glyoxalase n=1 Tax=Corynebacterium suranareeae TaxID=2506452 RepID=A0A160PMQ4_9CORY|nr:VOC family protein [Corynebacterium suranareeae]BAU95117.1 glyoxalase [Corynebacterium suranareeae]
MGIKRLDNVAIVVESLDEAVGFFEKLGMSLNGRTTAQGDFVDHTVGLTGVTSEIAVLETPDRHSRVELTQYLHPEPITTAPPAPNQIGMHRLMFAVDDIEETIAHIGAEPLDGIANYEDTYRLCYLRGPSGIIVALAQEL